MDDNQHGLVARRTLLEELGYSVTTATTGEAAFELFRNGKFDLVITDHKMPRMSGSDLIVKVRDLQPATRIIMLSGFVDALGLTEDTTGADVVIAKNAGEVGNLLRAVTRLLSRRISRKPPAAQSRPGRSRSAGV
ncbi:MAG TPA: response regulator [Bryobacteraceae bacterium]|nr:response regulator [Bryobacteraceae bacterium]